MDGAIECLPIVEGDKLVGVMTSSDLLLSWNRLHPVLQQAGTDGLTGLANRATFDRRLTEELERALRQQVALSLILFDVDHFKKINDACGHLTGDAVLRTIAVGLSRHLRMYDVLARFGGDEFAAICSGCNLQDIQVPIQRVQHAIGRLSVPVERERRGITLSIGTAVLRNRSSTIITPTQLIQAADDCLYRAKANGRSRSCSVELGDGSKPVFPAFQPLDASLGTQPLEPGAAEL
jgi:diguanylate cyclase (GGDEF)-like protein